MRIKTRRQTLRESEKTEWPANLGVKTENKERRMEMGGVIFIIAICSASIVISIFGLTHQVKRIADWLYNYNP